MFNGANRRNILFLAAFILLLSTVLIGCTNAGEGSAAKRENDNMLTIAWPQDVGEMNPHVYNPSQLFAQSMVYEPLVSYQDGGDLKPHLAESWDISKDGKVYTFYLRKGVKFSDGTSFNAQIVKKNFDTLLKNVELHSWLGFITKIERTDVIDENTFQLTLKEPYYPTIQELAVVRPVRFLGEAGFPEDGDTSKGVVKPVGTGPWVLEEYKADEYAVFKRNEKYWGELPKEEKIKVKIIPDAETRVLAFEKGDLDIIYGEGIISLDAFKQLESTGKYETRISEPVATRQLVINTKKEQLSDERVRQALHYGFNKEAMVEGNTSGYEEKSDYILPANLPYTKDIDADVIDYDAEKAKSLLDEAGWTLPKGKTVREKDGQPLEIELMYNSAESIQKTMAETLQAEWAAIGIKLNIVGVELTKQIQRFKGNEFDINFFSNYGAPYDPHTFLNIVASEGFGFNEAISAYSNKEELLKQIAKVPQTIDEKQRQKLYSSILKSIQDQGAIIPVSYIKKTAIYQKDVTNFTFPANRDEHPFTGISIE
ncbi:nickel ABC transporter substrate-binding protein [Bacillus swezeyi]|uniref:Nickel ABC transporter, nickel/metallophore periplasmic binding protein n=1 Tax=Bacillus swezeyi TaxID=1925020 RepID=A0A1R1RPD0_9BACI|nr:nickel ABC transporter substrate-binding protein [Bacillus swezeyi]MEC1261470.1 nickel ABC transporter substrate-binding protein [Bacillus swezeyi]MED2926667.1 nickel ABC transporter substrate-binding protein [Bacillus swezeyi]MED2965771.1 nickel ABC transporter substrate-binding protein [Bacillus swezeyi]MED3070826.1 nickel ABC transporter substrate-binding protein [Bacillus swezeyi]MED3082486.1 nickel ABC transporter substrate-binding protein [Bacillus swezeyi]